ncbi:MAG: hypothetical protein KGL39_10455 [Patescibacteria group bacterium]|nr:hypothetical protein [Patescibacteria group bacterium]
MARVPYRLALLTAKFALEPSECWAIDAPNSSNIRRLLDAQKRDLCPDDVIKEAARAGRIDMLNRALALSDIIIDGQLFAYAALCNRLNVILWLRQEGRQWDYWACDSAATSGHLPLLRWLVKEGCAVDSGSIASAARGGHIAVMEWLTQQSGIRLHEYYVYTEAAIGGHLDVLKWLHARGYQPTERMYENAIVFRQYHLVEWLHVNCPRDHWVCAAAAEHGDLERLKWFIERDYPVGSSASRRAASAGRLEVLRWLVENGHPLDALACELASDRPDILEYLRLNGCKCGGDYH